MTDSQYIKTFKMTGKLIVFEGLDSSGKATQAKLLEKKLRQYNVPVETIDFPQYNHWSAVFVEKYLNGEFGESVDPYKASLFYALDRYAALKRLNAWLSEDKVIIANRYTPANQAYQGGKIKDTGKRKEFLEWLDDIEYTILSLPRPTLVLYLHVPLNISQGLLETRRKKDYIKDGNKDLHEKDIQLLSATEEVYDTISKNNEWCIIECTEKKQLLSKEEIHEKVWEEVRKII